MPSKSKKRVAVGFYKDDEDRTRPITKSTAELKRKKVIQNPKKFKGVSPKNKKEKRGFIIHNREYWFSKDQIQKEFGCPPEDVDKIWANGKRGKRRSTKKLVNELSMNFFKKYKVDVKLSQDQVAEGGAEFALGGVDSFYEWWTNYTPAGRRFIRNFRNFTKKVAKEHPKDLAQDVEFLIAKMVEERLRQEHKKFPKWDTNTFWRTHWAMDQGYTTASAKKLTKELKKALKKAGIPFLAVPHGTAKGKPEGEDIWVAKGYKRKAKKVFDSLPLILKEKGKNISKTVKSMRRGRWDDAICIKVRDDVDVEPISAKRWNSKTEEFDLRFDSSILPKGRYEIYKDDDGSVKMIKERLKQGEFWADRIFWLNVAQLKRVEKLAQIVPRVFLR